MNRLFSVLIALSLPVATAMPATAQDVDLEKIFICAPDGPIGAQTPEQCLTARNVLLNNCTSCHTFVPIVKAQKSDDAWTSLLDGHRERVLHMSEKDFEILGEFLRAHFNETEPVPQLPPALEALGSNQPA